MSKTSTVKESNTINMKTSKTSNLSNLELTMNIKLPQVIIKNNPIFNDHIYNYIHTYYFKNGTYFKNRLSWHESGTKLYINLAEIINKITPINDDASLSNNSSTLLIQIKNGFVADFAKKLPGWLNPLGWKCSEIKISAYNSTQFCGFDYSKDTEKGTAMYGVPAFMLILYIEPLTSDTIPICKTKILKPVKLEMNITNSPSSYRNVLMNNPIVSNTNEINLNVSETKETNPILTETEEIPDQTAPTRKFVKGRWIEN
jgi:hypothetical protein